MVLSNYHDPTEKESVKRRKQVCNETEVVVPTCFSDYQKRCGFAGSDDWILSVPASLKYMVEKAFILFF